MVWKKESASVNKQVAEFHWNITIPTTNPDIFFIVTILPKKSKFLNLKFRRKFWSSFYCDFICVSFTAESSEKCEPQKSMKLIKFGNTETKVLFECPLNLLKALNVRKCMRILLEYFENTHLVGHIYSNDEYFVYLDSSSWDL